MNFIYHGVPEQMIGSELMPLNKMSGSMSQLRTKYAAKYKGRQAVMRQTIPLLNCLWNDVVQFLPLHPQKVFDLQKELGLIASVPPYQFYEVPVTALDPKHTVVFFKTAPGDENTQVKWFSDVDFDSLQTMPVATHDYYRTLVGTGELPFNYQFIPHVLYQGTVDISWARIVTLS